MTKQWNILPSRATVICLTSALALLAGAGVARATGPVRPEEMCSRAVALVERTEGLPGQLLAAIARVESNRWVAKRQEDYAWPWTVGYGGQGYFYPTKAAAIAAVERLRAEGASSIDVGCMQINLRAHPKAFASLDEAFDPVANAAFAATLLKDSHNPARDWTGAVIRYHADSRAAGGIRYVSKVRRFWFDEHRRAVVAGIEARWQWLKSLAAAAAGDTEIAYAPTRIVSEVQQIPMQVATVDTAPWPESALAAAEVAQTESSKPAPREDRTEGVQVATAETGATAADSEAIGRLEAQIEATSGWQPARRLGATAFLVTLDNTESMRD